MKLQLNDPSLRGMTKLDREKFKLNVSIPVIQVNKKHFGDLKRALRAYTFELTKTLKSLQDTSETEPHKFVILDPDKFDANKLDESTRAECLALLNAEISEPSTDLSQFVAYKQVEFTYDDMKFEEVIKSIIPVELLSENVNVKGYSIIGHIAHFNLRDQILAYKHIIGQVLLDKVNHIKTVVNKLNEIDNTYRNFAFEILAGENNTIVECKENNCFFEFDFATVYWNPRLGTEHERIVKMLNANDVVYDVFAGVGPFAVPAVTHRKCTVLANDLNPHSYKYLLGNYERNNKSKTKRRQLEERARLEKRQALLFDHETSDESVNMLSFDFDPTKFFDAFNMDGRDFIRTKLKGHLIECLNYRYNTSQRDRFGAEKYYALMNLPAMSVEFLDAFKNVYNEQESELIRASFNDKLLDEFKLRVHCYHFVRTEPVSELDAIYERIRNQIYGIKDLAIEAKFVRKVAPNKDMYCSMFNLTFETLLYDSNNSKNEPPLKVQKIE